MKNGFEARPGQWLKVHLREVSEQAGDFAAVFGAEAWGRAAGLLHDIGKYSREFQEQLKRDGHGLDHSTAGAREAQRAYRYGLLLAYMIAGHHGGLANEDILTERLVKRVPDYSAHADEISVPPEPALPGLTPADQRHQGFCCAFFVRMVFSCLVDADRLNSEAHADPGKAALRDGRPGLRALKERLDVHLERLQAEAEDTRINRLRRSILAQCRAAAALPPGLFSLTVPTGGGKTLASLAFALDHAAAHAAAHGLRRVIYAIPYTSIIEQNAEVFREILGQDAVLEYHSSVDLTSEGGAEQDTALAASLAMENWEVPLVVTTNVQFLESLFACKASRCRKLHNVAKSVIILDEAQMLPRELLKPTLAALKELTVNYGCTVVLCTATQPAVTEHFPGGADIREIMRGPGPTELYEAFRRVRVELAGEMDDAALAEIMGGQEQCLCVVNRREHARLLFERIRHLPGAHHLSALMCPQHRSEKFKVIRAALKNGLPCRVATTSLIEAGVDVDAPLVLRAMAGNDSLAQAAGRCNREGKLPEPGRVIVFTSSEWKPLGWLNEVASIGGTVCRAYPDDPLSLGAVAAYFGNLYDLAGEKLDAKGILARLNRGAGELAFPFADVAAAYRLIEDAGTTVFIPYDEVARGALAKIRRGCADREDYRRLQRYAVRVYGQHLRDLRNAVETVAEGVLALADMSLYDKETGLGTTSSLFNEGSLIV
ncbi:MAG: CRISPR-associated helicase Cas3' [Desulfovibrio aminophilus]|uniref:CRISPR-associated helicase Cas3' n=1 Tax=Desulfovibrio aminophilus TaxID=81425 RepID=UPI0039ECBF6D